MLVLTRKKDESIMLGKEIEIVVLEITPTQVRLGVDAPKNCVVFRKEIFLEIEAENLQAAQPAVFMDELGAEVKALWRKPE